MNRDEPVADPAPVVVHDSDPLPDRWTSTVALAGADHPEERAAWRQEAIDLLSKHRYSGVVFPDITFPSSSIMVWDGDFRAALLDSLICWLPDGTPVDRLPSRCPQVAYQLVVGTPRTGPYHPALRLWAERVGVYFASSLREAIDISLSHLNPGAVRRHAERFVPLEVWRSVEFQSWYDAQLAAGNRLEDARVVWAFRGLRASNPLWYWSLHVDMHIDAEQRRKRNEVLIGRPNIAVTVMYARSTERNEYEIALVREYRVSGVSNDGYVTELPGGAADPGMDPRAEAARECLEEVGLNISPRRLRAHGARQLASTMSVHHAYLFSVELSEDELSALREREGSVVGTDWSERTFVVIRSFEDIVREELLDWSMTAMLECVAREVGFGAPA